MYSWPLTIILWCTCFFAQAQLSKPGTEYRRTIGRFALQYRIDSSGNGILCRVMLQDSIISLVHLNQIVHTQLIKTGGSGKAGSLQLGLKFPDKQADLVRLYAETLPLALADSIGNFNGLVAAWLPSFDRITEADSIVYRLSPVLTSIVMPQGEPKSAARVDIYSGSLLAFSATLTQTTPIIAYDADIIIGDMKIEKGMQLILQIPTAVQKGSIRLNAVFSSSTIPPTQFNAFVATWEL